MSALAAVVGLALAGCGGGDAAGSSTTLSIVGFAVPEAANKAIAAEWNKTEAGKGSASVRRTVPPATRAGPSSPGWRPTTSTSRSAVT
ncbi:hypothetical protein GCM10029963_12880 [Micromonospora andamanensis]